MGWFSSKSERAENWTREAEESDAKAKAARSAAAEHRQALKNGTSQDRYADRSLLRDREADEWVNAENARDFRANAKDARKGFWG